MDPQYFDEGKQRSLEDIFGSSVRGMTPSELWRVRESLGEAGGAAWDLGEFEPEGWRFAQDIPYGLGLLGDELYVREPYGQLGREGDPRFLQDRYEEAAIANDFPAEWVDTSTGKWTGPAQMEGYWDQLTNAIRNEAGWLRANIDLPEGPQAIIPNAPIGSYGPAWGGAGGLPGPGGVGTAGAYTPMEAQDWSGIMPQGVFAGSEVQPTQAMQGLVAGQGLQYQPWAMAEDSVQGVPFVPQTVQYVPPTGYTPVVSPAIGNGNENGNGAAPTHWEIMAQHYDALGIPHINGVPINTGNTSTTNLLDNYVDPSLNVNPLTSQIGGLDAETYDWNTYE